jgi:fructokinase
MTLDILTLGELLIDMFPAEVGRGMAEVTAFRPKPGGAPANVAVAAARLGSRAGFIGKVGEDTFGHYLEGVLNSERVNTSGLRFDPQARTTLVFIALPDENSAEFVFYRNPGADMLLSPEDLDRTLLSETACLHFGSLSLIVEPSGSATRAAVAGARQAGALISFDVNYRPTLWQSAPSALDRVVEIIPSVDLLKVNETELGILSGQKDLEPATKALLQMGPKLCVVTLGQRGSYYRSAAGGEFVPAFGVHTVDATGCGDAFIAGLLTRLVGDGRRLADLSPERLGAALRFANAVGALTAQTLGVIPALPRLDRVVKFLEENRIRQADLES